MGFSHAWMAWIRPGIGPGTAGPARAAAWKPWRRAGRSWAPAGLEVAGSALVMAVTVFFLLRHGLSMGVELISTKNLWGLWIIYDTFFFYFLGHRDKMGLI